MPKAIISLGSNIGNRKDYLNQSINRLEEIGQILNVSKFYETEPYGVKNQDYFLNAVVSMETKLNPFELLEQCQEIEEGLGRKRETKWGPRTIDLDILFYNNKIIDDETLTIPHKEITKRNFILTPLKDIEPNFIHPIENKTIAELFEELETTDKVFLMKEQYDNDN